MHLVQVSCVEQVQQMLPRIELYDLPSTSQSSLPSTLQQLRVQSDNNPTTPASAEGLLAHPSMGLECHLEVLASVGDRTLAPTSYGA